MELADAVGRNTLLDLVLQTSLSYTLTGWVPLTIFVPVDNAFSAIPDELLTPVDSDEALLTND